MLKQQKTTMGTAPVSCIHRSLELGCGYPSGIKINKHQSQVLDTLWSGPFYKWNQNSIQGHRFSSAGLSGQPYAAEGGRPGFESDPQPFAAWLYCQSSLYLSSKASKRPTNILKGKNQSKMKKKGEEH